jgi:Tfp pilus assembly protein PilF
MLNKAEMTEKYESYRRIGWLFALIITAAIIFALIPWYSHHLQIKSLKQAENGEQVRSLHIAEDAIRVNPTSIQAKFVLAGAQQRLGRETEARKTLVGAVALQPLNYETWLQLALFERDKLGETTLANMHFATAMTLSPYDDHLQVDAGVKQAEDI